MFILAVTYFIHGICKVCKSIITYLSVEEDKSADHKNKVKVELTFDIVGPRDTAFIVEYPEEGHSEDAYEHKLYTTSQ